MDWSVGRYKMQSFCFNQVLSDHFLSDGLRKIKSLSLMIKLNDVKKVYAYLAHSK